MKQPSRKLSKRKLFTLFTNRIRKKLKNEKELKSKQERGRQRSRGTRLLATKVRMLIMAPPPHLMTKIGHIQLEHLW